VLGEFSYPVSTPVEALQEIGLLQVRIHDLEQQLLSKAERNKRKAERSAETKYWKAEARKAWDVRDKVL